MTRGGRLRRPTRLFASCDATSPRRAKAGILFLALRRRAQGKAKWIPAFAGMTRDGRLRRPTRLFASCDATSPRRATPMR
jgi:hypothetical protein